MSESEIVNLINTCVKRIDPRFECDKIYENKYKGEYYYIFYCNDLTNKCKRRGKHWGQGKRWGLGPTRDLTASYVVLQFELFLKSETLNPYLNERLTEKQFLTARHLYQVLGSASSWEEVKMLCTLDMMVSNH